MERYPFRYPGKDEEPMNGENVTRIQLGEKEIILVGTAHVSKHSVEQVKEVIESEKPDAVCIELDEQRYQSIMDRDRWRKMDIFKVIKEKKAALLLVNLLLSSFQKRIARQFGITPGQEMIQGIESAKAAGAELVLADRSIQVTFSRIWHGMSLMGKAKLMTQLITSIFSNEEITEQEMEQMKSQDMIQAMLQDFADSFPELKKPLIDERDQYLAYHIRNAPGNKVVAVLGAAHVPGVTRYLHQKLELASLTQVPPKSKRLTWLAWAIPILIIGLIAYTFYLNPSAGLQQTLSWILWNGSFAALGAALAFAHPLAIATAFVIAPISSLNPLMAAGWFSGFVQAFIRRPSVADFENLSEDVFSIKGFWRNQVTRILLVVVLTNIGSALGTFVGGADVIRRFIDHL